MNHLYTLIKMDELCRKLTLCHIIHKPQLYDMMIYDFETLSKQYSINTNEYVFDMKPEYDFITFQDLEELLVYLQKNNVEEILSSIIKERYPCVFIDQNIITSMVDYYIENLIFTKKTL